MFSGKTLAYILLCKKKTKLEVSCGKKSQPAVNFQRTEKFPPSITATSVALGFLGSLSSKLNSTWKQPQKGWWWEASPILGESNLPMFHQKRPPDPPDPNLKALLKKGIPRFHLAGANDPTPNPKLLRIFC